MNTLGRRSSWLIVVTILLVVVVGIVVLALPGAPPRKYPNRIPVRFWHMWTAEWKTVVEQIVDRFNESQDTYEVLPLSVPGTAGDYKLILSTAGGNPPDVMTQWAGVSKLADSGALIPLNSFMTPEEWERFKQETYPAAKRIGMYKDNLYGITTGLNTWACYVRYDHLHEAGLDPAQFPNTLEGLVKWAEPLTRFDAQGNITRLGFLPIWFAMYAPGFGGGFCNWQTGALTLNTPENLRAMEYLLNERKKLGVEKVLNFNAGLTTGIGNVEWPFISGAFSITVDGQWRVQQLAKYAPELQYFTIPMPPPTGGKPHYGWVNGNFMVIPKGAKQAQGAWEFIKFWSGWENPDRAAEFYTWGGWLPSWPKVANAPLYQAYIREHPQFKTFLDVLPSENEQPTPPVPYQNYLWDRITQADDSAMRCTITPQQALERLDLEISRERAQRREFGYVD